MVITRFYKRSGCPGKGFFETYVLLAGSTGEKNTLVSKNKMKFRQTLEKTTVLRADVTVEKFNEIKLR